MSDDIHISVISALIILGKINSSYERYCLFAYVSDKMPKEHMDDNMDVNSNSTHFQRQKTKHAVNVLV